MYCTCICNTLESYSSKSTILPCIGNRLFIMWGGMVQIFTCGLCFVTFQMGYKSRIWPGRILCILCQCYQCHYWFWNGFPFLVNFCLLFLNFQLKLRPGHILPVFRNLIFGPVPLAAITNDWWLSHSWLNVVSHCTIDLLYIFITDESDSVCVLFHHSLSCPDHWSSLHSVK